MCKHWDTYLSHSSTFRRYAADVPTILITNTGSAPASFVVVSSFKFGALFSPGLVMFVLGPCLIFGIQKFHAKLVDDSDAPTTMTSIAFEEHMHVLTSSIDREHEIEGRQDLSNHAELKKLLDHDNGQHNHRQQYHTGEQGKTVAVLPTHGLLRAREKVPYRKNECTLEGLYLYSISLKHTFVRSVSHRVGAELQLKVQAMWNHEKWETRSRRITPVGKGIERAHSRQSDEKCKKPAKHQQWLWSKVLLAL
ncbi:hypothetical protein DFH29DRAFT_879567 [Suillus ampliporus]|nr:hypothetical protein DFH29DRAFT_879567 [Suillus ampliporus]